MISHLVHEMDRYGHLFLMKPYTVEKIVQNVVFSSSLMIFRTNGRFYSLGFDKIIHVEEQFLKSTVCLGICL